MLLCSGGTLTDERLRKFEREQLGVDARGLLERIRAGSLHRDQIELAAYLAGGNQ